MRALIQRVSHAKVEIDGDLTGEISRGLLVLIGIENTDNETDIDYLVGKISKLRIFDDEEGVMNKSVLDIDGDVMIVSQFTLYACTKKGNRPSYIRSAKPETAIPIYEKFCKAMSDQIGKEVQTGIFGADMQVSLLNDGPVTIWIDSKNKDY
ncbi:MAG: D-aminoacyl-tRNA deacylase [Fermentimonas sp.]|jgi:D-tyrosyl-tRNA(Tyr) deacylase